MKFPWKKSPGGELIHTLSEEGIAFSLAGISSTKWWEQTNEASGYFRPEIAYLCQLVDEGIAIADGDAIQVSWSHYYALSADASHEGSLSLLGVPEIKDWAPCLESRGTPSQADFSLAVVSWQSPKAGRRSLNRIGGSVCDHGIVSLISHESWKTCVAIESFSRSSEKMSPHERMRVLGEIRMLAVRAGAMLDAYLERTNIVTSEKVHIELNRVDVLGVPVVEIKPSLSGAPSEFLDVFDRYGNAQPRYDIVQPDGELVHVVPSPAAMAVLSSIKAIEGRRIASDEARIFGRNPFATLSEEAFEALDEDELIKARQDADLLPYTLAFEIVEPGSTATVRMIPLNETSSEFETAATQQVSQELLELSGLSRAKGMPLFHWRGYEIEMGPLTEAALQQLAEWLAHSAVETEGYLFSEVMSLEAYGERVIGFDSPIKTVPFVAKKDSATGWVSDNVHTGIVTVDQRSGELTNVAMPPENVTKLQSSMEEAEATGASTVNLPNTEIEIPLDRAKQLVDILINAAAEIGKKKKPVSTQHDPKSDRTRLSLKIHHNIETLDYIASELGHFDDAEQSAPKLPDAFQLTLLPHQEYGLAWLQHRYGLQSKGFSGCLLADDMGLGKTLQSLCLIAWHNEENEASRPCLVVAPVSLLENWKLEIEKFLDYSDGDVLSLYGRVLSELRLDTKALGTKLTDAGVRKLLKPGFEKGYRIVLTTYETLRDYEFSLARVDWGVIVCDEAQKIKNPAAFVTQAAKSLKADFRVACTGTPVENSLADLWCLFDFFQPGYLGSLNGFTKEYRRDIESRSEGHEALVERLREVTKPWILRRMKFEVQKGLPAKLEGEKSDKSCIELPMSSLQSKLYVEAINTYRAAKDPENKADGMQILALLQRLRMICANPLSVVKADHEVRSLSEHLAASPKLAWLMRRLSEIRHSEEKAIIFTEFRDIQRLLQRAIAEQFGYVAQVINGSTTVDNAVEHSRQRIISKFESEVGFGVIILSTTAVGFGVNIQAANHVIHFTRSWNPAKEDQATDRAYRIGQTKDVYVYCPTVAGSGFESFEERLAHLLESKRSLSRDMLAGTQEVTVDDFVDI